MAGFKEKSARNEFNNQEYYYLVDELNKMKIEFGMLSIPAPTMHVGSAQLYGTDTKSVIESIIEANYGAQLHTIAIRSAIANIALKAEFTGKALPVFVYSKSNNIKIDTQLLPDMTDMRSINEEPTDDSVKQVLEEVRAKLIDSSLPNDKTNDETNIENKEVNTDKLKPTGTAALKGKPSKSKTTK